MKFTEIAKNGAQIDYGVGKFTLGRVQNALEAFAEYDVKVDFVKNIKSYNPRVYDEDEKFIEVAMPRIPIEGHSYVTDLKWVYRDRDANYIIEHATNWIRKEIEQCGAKS